MKFDGLCHFAGDAFKRDSVSSCMIPHEKWWVFYAENMRKH